MGCWVGCWLESAGQYRGDMGGSFWTTVHTESVPVEIKVVDNVAKGPSIGGVRMAPDVTTEECARLARAMTFKNAAAGLLKRL